LKLTPVVIVMLCQIMKCWKTKRTLHCRLVTGPNSSLL